jgi:segregation and condensation protein B
MALDNTRAVVEAMLFISDKPLTIEQIKDVVDNLDAGAIRQIVSELNAEYEQLNRGIRIAEVAGGFRMITPPALAPFLRKMYKQRRAERLSKPALETLAIIAYKQPLTRLEIETLRNVNVDGVMSSLVEKGLIRITGRKNAPGRPFVYGTTRQFMEYFGLKSLDDLPKMEKFSELKPAEEKPAEEKPAEEKKDEPAKVTQGN